MANKKIIKTFKIKSVEELFDFIQGKNNFEDLREKFIFRGIENEKYQLIPSALREKNDGHVIDDYIVDSEFRLCWCLSPKQSFEEGFISREYYKLIGDKGKMFFYTNKSSKSITENENCININNKSDFYLRKEIYVLMKFLNFADKSGLKVPVTQRIRNSIHSIFDNGAKKTFHSWPNFEYFELISLAQHYGIPTRALDWSYDYKVALYFAVKDILKDENNSKNNCVLWALNYKKFEFSNNELTNSFNEFHFHYYRPEYVNNPNLNAQKGLFTFWINNLNEDVNLKPLDEIIFNELENAKKEYDGDEVKYKLGRNINLSLKNDEKIFYKIIIPGKLKAEILNELYLEGYSEEFLFPGYFGVTDSIKNKTKIDYLLNK